ncbi:uncharacterized protein METZ01_LOCUS43681, partial [marine metagenome]
VVGLFLSLHHEVRPVHVNADDLLHDPVHIVQTEYLQTLRNERPESRHLTR